MAEEADGSGFKAGAASFQLCSLGPGAPFPSASVSSRVKWGGEAQLYFPGWVK